jgi:hypothetical protein
MTDEEFNDYLANEPGSISQPVPPPCQMPSPLRDFLDELWKRKERHTFTGLDRDFLRSLRIRWDA